MSGFEALRSGAQWVADAVLQPPMADVFTWILVGVFAWSGIVKLKNPIAAAMAMVDFNVVRRARRLYGFGLGAAETTLAVWLALGLRPQAALGAASILFATFVILIGRSLTRGAEFTCHCFGDDEGKISVKTLARALMLLSLSGLLFLAAPIEEGSLGATDVPAAVTGVAIVGMVALASRLRRLLTWNRDPYSIGPAIR